jgi:CRISPR-associated protein Cas1
VLELKKRILANILSEKKHLKTILQSKRANIYYLEYCRVLQNGGRVEYITQEKDKQAYWNIPIANTTVILLGTGTSITQAAVRLLASAGVMIGFCGGDGTPLFAGNEIEWMSPQSEYRPTEYVQGWLSFWFNPEKRLHVAKELQSLRLNNISNIWRKEALYKEFGIYADDQEFESIMSDMAADIDNAASVQNLLEIEGRTTKRIYAYIVQTTGFGSFKRNHEGSDTANIFLNHGNYLAYGLAATALWTLGIPHSFAVMHGKTRRGALVFDIADLIKDAIVLPTAFVCALRGDDERKFRETLMNLLIDKYSAIDIMIESIKLVCSQFAEPVK